MGAKGLTERDYAEMERMYIDGLVMEEIAHWFAVTRQWVHQVLRQRGIDTRDQYLDRLRIVAEQRAARSEQIRYRTCTTCGVTYDRHVTPQHNKRHLRRDTALDAALVEAYLTGERVEDIEARFNVVPTILYRAIHRAGVPLRKNGRRARTLDESHARQAKILELRTTGLSFMKIATELDVSASLVGQICKRAGLGTQTRTRDGRSWTAAERQERHAKILELRRTGLTISRIATELDVSRSLAGKICKRAGI